MAAELRRHARRTRRAAGAPAQPAAERHHRHRGRHGDRHPAAQPARGGRRLPAPARTARRVVAGAHEVREGSRSADRRRDHLAARRHRGVLRQGHGQLQGARRVRDGGRQHRHHGAAVAGLRLQGARADRRADARQEAADGRGPARRVRPREPDAPRHRAEGPQGRCRAADGASLRHHRPRAQLPRQPQRHRARRPAARHGPARDPLAVARVPHRHRQAPPRVAAREGRAPPAYPRGPARGLPQPRRGDPHHPSRGRAEARPHEALLAQRDPGRGHPRDQAAPPRQARGDEDPRRAGRARRRARRAHGRAAQRDQAAQAGRHRDRRRRREVRRPAPLAHRRA